MKTVLISQRLRMSYYYLFQLVIFREITVPNAHIGHLTSVIRHLHDPTLLRPGHYEKQGPPQQAGALFPHLLHS